MSQLNESDQFLFEVCPDHGAATLLPRKLRFHILGALAIVHVRSPLADRGFVDDTGDAGHELIVQGNHPDLDTLACCLLDCSLRAVIDLVTEPVLIAGDRDHCQGLPLHGIGKPRLGFPDLLSESEIVGPGSRPGELFDEPPRLGQPVQPLIFQARSFDDPPCDPHRVLINHHQRHPLTPAKEALTFFMTFPCRALL
ncbi:MAG: hypothetical protein CVU57_03570 [Deltaproteobacteria bacterium HGW-Deltaproteobacteria-15]|nr:MAG: hypothetical protein CVU57_03570 [Deltaproteobacteria bacterium HGW-Deltaproteobacteria-15]